MITAEPVFLNHSLGKCWLFNSAEGGQNTMILWIVYILYFFVCVCGGVFPGTGCDAQSW